MSVLDTKTGLSSGGAASALKPWAISLTPAPTSSCLPFGLG